MSERPYYYLRPSSRIDLHVFAAVDAADEQGMADLLAALYAALASVHDTYCDGATVTRHNGIVRHNAGA